MATLDTVFTFRMNQEIMLFLVQGDVLYLMLGKAQIQIILHVRFTHDIQYT